MFELVDPILPMYYFHPCEHLAPEHFVPGTICRRNLYPNELNAGERVGTPPVYFLQGLPNATGVRVH